MLGLEDFMTIQALVKRGVYLCDIAEQLGVHPKTVSRAMQRGGQPALRRGRRGSLLDPYRPAIDGLLTEGVWNAVVIWRELQTRGYKGDSYRLREKKKVGLLGRKPKVIDDPGDLEEVGAEL